MPLFRVGLGVVGSVVEGEAEVAADVEGVAEDDDEDDDEEEDAAEAEDSRSHASA